MVYNQFYKREDKVDLKGLYGQNANIREKEDRFEKLRTAHEELFGKKATAIFSASGRTELGGNHTDHNLGRVLASSISLDTIAAVHEEDSMRVRIISEGFDPIEMDLSSTNPIKSEEGTTQALVRGIADSILNRGGYIKGFTANISSSVLPGSGLSSSASVEVLIGTIFSSLFNNDRFSTTEIAIMGQEAENIHFGKPCGLMDQVACANGGIVRIDFKNPKCPVITPIQTDFESYGYSLVIVNTGGSHADLTPDYAAIPSEMKAVASYFGKNTLSEVDRQEFLSSLKGVREALNNDRALLRTFHYFSENDRVDRMVDSLLNNDFETYLDTVRECGRSSVSYLQNAFSPQHPDMQGITTALALSEELLKDKGASRLHGGGFAGTIQAYVPIDETDSYISAMEAQFGASSCTRIAIRPLPVTRVI